MAEVEIRWSRKAIRQVEKIGEYIELDSPWQAARVVRKLYSAPRRISWSPRKGRIVPELRDPDLREISILSWRVIYRLVDDKDDKQVEIVAVIHARRHLSKRLL